MTSITIGGEDLTELVDMDSLQRTMTERGEASCTFVIPCASDDEVPSNAVVRDAEVVFAVDGATRWLGHVVDWQREDGGDLAVECAGEWDRLHHREDYGKVFVEVRPELWEEMPNELSRLYIGFAQSAAMDVDTSDQLLFTLPMGSTATAKPHRTMQLWLGGGLLTTPPNIKRVTFDYTIGGRNNDITGEMYCQTTPYSVAAKSTVWTTPQVAGSGSVDWTPPDGSQRSALVMWAQMNASPTSATQDAFIQIRNLRIYADRTTAPNIGEAVAEIWTQVTGSSDVDVYVPTTLDGHTIDPPTTAADAITQTLARNDTPPLCGVIHGRLRCRTRPGAWFMGTYIVSPLLTPGLEWDVLPDRAQSKDYVSLAYEGVPAEAITHRRTDGTNWPTSWYRSSDTNCTAYAGGFYRVLSNATVLNPSAYQTAVMAVSPGDLVRASAGVYLGAYVSGRARIAVRWLDSGGGQLSESLLYDRASADATERVVRGVYAAPASAASARLAIYWTGATSGPASIYARDLSMQVVGSVQKRIWYPSAPTALTDRSLHIDAGALLSDAEALTAAQQAYAFHHERWEGQVVIPSICHDINGQEISAEHIECWQGVTNVGLADTAAGGPFLISEVTHHGREATLTIGSGEGYAYASPYRLPSKGRFVGARRVRRRYRQWSTAKRKPTGQGWRRQGRRWWRWSYKWVERQGRYV